jgi:hypothetical protein
LREGDACTRKEQCPCASQKEDEKKDEQGITKEDLQTALLKTKNGKSTGEDGINSELYKYAGDKFCSRLLKFFNNIYKNA